MHDTDVIELQVSLLLFVALAGYLLSAKIIQPPVIGQMSAKGITFFIVGAFIGQKFVCRLIAAIDERELGRRYTEITFIFAMIIALLGLNTDLIKQPLYVTLVLMGELTTLIIPPALRVLIPKA